MWSAQAAPHQQIAAAEVYIRPQIMFTRYTVQFLQLYSEFGTPAQPTAVGKRLSKIVMGGKRGPRGSEGEPTVSKSQVTSVTGSGSAHTPHIHVECASGTTSANWSSRSVHQSSEMIYQIHSTVPAALQRSGTQAQRYV